MENHETNISSIEAIEEHVMVPGDSHEELWLGPNMIFVPGTPARDFQIHFSVSDRKGGDSVQGKVPFTVSKAPESSDGFAEWHTSWKPADLPEELQPRTDEEGFCFMPSFNWKHNPASGKAIGFGVVHRHAGRDLSNHLDHISITYSVYDPKDKAFAPWNSFRVTTDRVERPCVAYGQRVDLPNGDILLPFSTVKENLGWDTIYWSGSVRLRLEDNLVNVIGVSNLVSQPKLRGFVEPSMAESNGLYYMTLRANDGYAYVTTSIDGLSWDRPVTWNWDDGTPMETNQTMTKFINNQHGLFFVYTRKTGDNENVVRHRAPLFVAQIDPEKACLIRGTESTLMANRGLPLGNFSIREISDQETWVTAPEWDRSGEEIPCDNRLTRICWK